MTGGRRRAEVIPTRNLDTGRMAGAAAWRTAFLVIQGGSSVVLLTVLAHLLGRQQLAAVTVAQGILVIAQAVGDFGLSQVAVTVLPARLAANPGQREVLLGAAAELYFWAGGAALILTLAAVAVVPVAAEVPIAVLAPAAAATVIVSGADGILRAQGQFRRPAMLMAASEAGAFIGVPVAIATRSAAWTCVAISLGTTVGAAGAALALVRLRHSGTRPHTRPLLRASLPLGLSQVFIALGARVDTLLASAGVGLLAGGTFDGAWRTYQIGQYAVGAVATAAAPFVSDALGAGAYRHALRLLRGLLLLLVAIGVGAGVVLYLCRHLVADALTGSLGGPVAGSLPLLAAISPLAAAGTLAFYTLSMWDGERRYVLGAFAVGAAINIALGSNLAARGGVHGVIKGCVAGLAVTNLVLLARAGVLMRTLRRLDEENPPTPTSKLGLQSPVASPPRSR